MKRSQMCKNLGRALQQEKELVQRPCGREFRMTDGKEGKRKRKKEDREGREKGKKGKNLWRKVVSEGER